MPPTIAPLGAPCWNANATFYNGLTLAMHGDETEMDFAARFDLGKMFPSYEVLWKRHVCPATTRPHGKDFLPGISKIMEVIAQKSYSALNYLVDALESMAKVHAGDRGPRLRNCRDALKAAGDALQVASELQYSVCGNSRRPADPNLAAQLGVTLNPFPDWATHWAADREQASLYRNYLTHQGLMYAVRNAGTGEVLVLSRAAFAAGAPTWKQAETTYKTNPGLWKPVEQVCDEIIADTTDFLDRSYERLIKQMDTLLTNPAYQRLWGWQPHTAAASPVVPAAAPGVVSMSACSNVLTIGGTPPHKTSITSGGCNF